MKFSAGEQYEQSAQPQDCTLCRCSTKTVRESKRTRLQGIGIEGARARPII